MYEVTKIHKSVNYIMNFDGINSYTHNNTHTNTPHKQAKSITS